LRDRLTISPLMRSTALCIVLLWAAWWVFFATADAVVAHRFRGAITFAAIAIATVVMAWKWPLAASALLVLESIASTGTWAPMWIRRFDFWQVVFLFAIMPLPPLVCAVLLLLSRRRDVLVQ